MASATVNPQVPGSSPGRGAKNSVLYRLPNSQGWAFLFCDVIAEEGVTSNLHAYKMKARADC